MGTNFLFLSCSPVRPSPYPVVSTYHDFSASEMGEARSDESWSLKLAIRMSVSDVERKNVSRHRGGLWRESSLHGRLQWLRGVAGHCRGGLNVRELVRSSSVRDSVGPNRQRGRKDGSAKQQGSSKLHRSAGWRGSHSSRILISAPNSRCSIVHTSIDSHFVRSCMRRPEEHCAKENSFLQSLALALTLASGTCEQPTSKREDTYE
jgi:hypothetical protein